MRMRLPRQGDLGSSVLALFAAFAFVSFSTAVVGPVLGQLDDEFGVSYASLGLIAGMQAISRGVAMIPAGRLADRYPPRALVSLGGMLMVVGSLAAAAAPTFPILVLGTAVIGVSMALIFTAGMTHLVRSSSADDRGRTVGRAMAGWGLGSFLAPVAAGALASAFDWRSVFLLAAVFSVAAVPLGWTIRGVLPSPPEPSPAESQRRWALGMTRPLIPVVVLSALVWGSGSAIMRLVLPLYGSEGAQLSPALIGVWLSLFAAVTFGIMLVSGSILDRVGRLPVLLLAAIPGIIGGLVLLLPVGLLPFVFFGLTKSGIGFSMPLIPVLVADRSAPAHVGRSMGIVQFLTDIVNLALPLALGALLDVSGFGALGIFFVVAFTAAAIFGARLIASTPPQPSAPESDSTAPAAGPAPPPAA